MIIGSQGTLFQHDIITPGSPPTHAYTTIAQIETITPPTIAQGEKDNTAITDTTKIPAPTIPDCGEISLKIQYDPLDTTHLLLHTLLYSGAADPWRMIYNDAPIQANRSNDAFTGWVKSFTPGEMNTDGNVEAEITIRLTAKPVRTPRGTGTSP
jgi:hypothetical protein